MDNSEMDLLADKIADRIRPPLVVNQNQISAMLGFSCIQGKVSQTVRNIINRPDFPAPFYLSDGKSKRWRYIDVQAWINGLYHEELKLRRIASIRRRAS
ncbi:helix-turn-helix transcriptional regulator [Parasutterella sp.]|jgi:predicted DNA-binding transcriptional regulator AlpA|uniref:helix-turn-helix transcriptional regulator n=1 Tax=Parasutterella sp. TaxID=2049037 RepID=UPI002070F46E|nr:MAG TPA: Pyocin activator protein PrtN [Caudoviricetes sp.]DAY69711.1 MAG TPA: Pyocin activator protein PrtN [Caudoviricetes sp.]